MRTALAAVSICIALVVTATAQRRTLSEDDLRVAITEGTKGKGKHQGLILRDSGQSFITGMSKTGGSSGFWVEIYTPMTWVMQEAANAAKRYQPMPVAGPVAPELLEPILRVIAHPDTPTHVTGSGMRGTSSVDHIVLRDESRTIVLQPIIKEPFAEDVSNAMGGKAEYNGLTATFSIEALREIRGPKNDREFFITVIGSTGEEKDFKVKRKHFDDLR